MRAILIVVLAITSLFAQTSCGLVSHQVHRATNLLKAPVQSLNSGVRGVTSHIL